MKRFLIAVLGNSDIKYKGSYVDKSNFRERTLELLGQAEEGTLELGSLEFPILEALARFPESREFERFDETLLVYTDQDSPHFSDTCHLYKLFRLWWMSKKDADPWRNLGTKAPKGRKVKGQPHDYDYCLNFGKKLAWQFEREVAEKDGELKFYVSLTGGTPALYIGILLGFIERWKERVIPVYVPRGSSTAFPLNVSFALEREKLKRILRALVMAKSYKSSERLLEENQDLVGGNQQIKELINSGYMWLNFDFQKSASFLNRAYTDIKVENRPLAQSLMQVVNKLKDEKESYDRTKQLLMALAEIIVVNLQKGQYPCALGNMFRFHEGLMMYILYDKCGVQFEDQGKRIKKDWIDTQKELANFLDQYEVNGEHLSWKNRKVNRRILEAMVDFYAKEGNIEDTTVSFLKTLKKLAELRNKTIIAHGYQGINRKMMEEKLGKGIDEFIRELRGLAKDIGGEPPDFLDKLNALICAEIDRLE